MSGVRKSSSVPVRFKPIHRRGLKECGLTNAAIDEVENMLRHIAADLRGDPPMDDLRRELTKLYDCLAMADKSLVLLC